MANVFDVAEFVLENLGPSSTMKLQKIIFYSHAYHLVCEGSPLVEDKIEAWANGPVIPVLFDKHRRSFVVSAGHFSRFIENRPLTTSESGAILSTLKVLGDKTGAELSDLTHSEAPWKDARRGLVPTARSHNEITDVAIRAFYSSEECQNPLFAQ